MASYLFKNIKTGETRVKNSKDAATAKRVYSNKTWIYIKPVSKLKPISTKQDKDLLELQMISRQLASSVIKLRDMSREYGIVFSENIASEQTDLVSKLQQKLRIF